jgi:hypothetical protein
MHFTPLGQMEIAAPTGLISFTASKRHRQCPHFLTRRQRSTRQYLRQSPVLSFCSPFICLKEIQQFTYQDVRRRKSRVNQPMHHFVALLLCVFALVLPFCESKISL